MAYIMLQYDRPADVRNWNEYNRRASGWIDRLLKIPGATSFMGYRTTDGSSPDTITMLEFRTLAEAKRASASDVTSAVLQELQSMGVSPKMLVLERSPYTPEPIRGNGAST
jgi:hypothetical protein